MSTFRLHGVPFSPYSYIVQRHTWFKQKEKNEIPSSVSRRVLWLVTSYGYLSYQKKDPGVRKDFAVLLDTQPGTCMHDK